MIRLLTAVFLFASFHVVAQTQVPNVFEDGTPASAAEVNANFDALETAIDAIPEGPAGPQGEQGPAGADGRDAVGGFSHSWTFNAGNQGYGQFSTGAFVARADSDYTSNKDGVAELWINLKDSESNTIGTGPSTTGGVDATGFFSFFDAGDLVSLKNIEDSGDSVIYRLTAKPQWEYTPTYASYVVLSVDNNSPAIIGPTGFTSDSTYAIDFTKNGVLSGLNCTTDQIIKWDGTNEVWVCATDPFAGLNCDVGDSLIMDSGGWECRAVRITASLIEPSWYDQDHNNPGPISNYFDSVNNVDPSSSCDGGCVIQVIGVTDHTSCVVQVTGGAVSGDADVMINTATSAIYIDLYMSWNEGQPVLIQISCMP